ncbi:hypothetical protein HMSSN036_40960 [Paenibacillus macerans]|nr:hypothetical protein HMSSN036_40960 [Paenibacillus macerans]
MGKSKHRFKKLSVLAVAFMIAGTSYSGFASPAQAAADEPATGKPAASEPYVWKTL